jgi:hypothetical protein
MRTTQFDLVDGDIELVKQRVNSWISSFSGADYYLEIISERHARIKKTKHDWKICCYGCVCYFVAIFGGVFMFMGLPYQSALSGLLSVIFIAIMIIPLFIGWFCLYPNKVEFDVQFIGSNPVKVRVVASGNMLAQAEAEYQSFLRAIGQYSSKSGIDLA